MTNRVEAGKRRRAWLARASLLVGTWSSPAAVRAVRAAVIIPALLALTSKVVGNPQMATYAAFGGFANLVLASFSGSRRDKLTAHVGLGVVGSALLSLGTAVHPSIAASVVVTLLVTFVVLLAGASGRNVAAGGLAAMLAYVLAAASPGVTSMIPGRIEGWLLATAVAAAAIGLMSPASEGNQLRSACADAAGALASETAAMSAGLVDASLRRRSVATLGRLRELFGAAPYRPTGLATADQALGNLVEMLGWTGTLLEDTVAEPGALSDFAEPNRMLLACASEVLGAVASMLAFGEAVPDLERLERLRQENARALAGLENGSDIEAAVHASFHARTLAVAVRSAAVDTLVATRRASAAAVAEKRMEWVRRTRRRPVTANDLGSDGLTGQASVTIATAGALLARHATVRSVWVRNSARGAVAVTAAVAVSELINVQHGFWIVLGTLSVLRTTATATGSTAVRALLGTTIGFVIGAAVIIAVGTNVTVLWLILPLAVLVAAYTPGVSPFAAGQAAFTALLVVLYNLLVPVGWKVGEIRIEDIALGCAISLVVGILVWPRGATAVVADDLHDAFVFASEYLVEATEGALGLRDDGITSGRDALVAALRLEDGLRAFLTEQGARPVAKEDLWALTAGAQRVRLTADALADLSVAPSASPVAAALAARARWLGDWYGRAATFERRGDVPVIEPLAAFPRLDTSGESSARRACQLSVEQHLRHLHIHHEELIGSATRMALAARQPWWHPEPPAAASATIPAESTASA